MRKETQNPSVTTTYSVGFNNDVEQQYKNKVKRSSNSEDIFLEKNQAIWLAKRIFGSKLKNQTVKLLKMTESTYFYKCRIICKN